MWAPSSRLLWGFDVLWPCLWVAMSSAGDCPIPSLISGDGPGSWSVSAVLYRFVWTVRRGCVSQSALLAVPGRASLALWIGGLELREFMESGSGVDSTDDEDMLDWIAVYVRRG